MQFSIHRLCLGTGYVYYIDAVQYSHAVFGNGLCVLHTCRCSSVYTGSVWERVMCTTYKQFSIHRLCLGTGYVYYIHVDVV